MLENLLLRRNASLRVRLTVKSAVSAGLILLALALPQVVHAVAGPQGGMLWLPMYLPVLLGGCLLGKRWGLGVGILAPVVSFLVTSLFGNPMPALARLPFMAAELAVFALISGAFADKIAENRWFAFPAVLLAQVCGRAVFLALAAIFGGLVDLSAAVVWSQIQSGLLGLLVQAVMVPFAVMGLGALLSRKE